MDKDKLYKKYEKAVIGFPYADTEDLTDEHDFIFEWFWKQFKNEMEDAWKYRDLCK